MDLLIHLLAVFGYNDISENYEKVDDFCLNFNKIIPQLWKLLTVKNEVYYLPFDHIAFFWDRMEKGGRKSFTYQEIDRSYAVRAHRDMLIHYLEPLKKDLERKDLVDK